MRKVTEQDILKALDIIQSDGATYFKELEIDYDGHSWCFASSMLEEGEERIPMAKIGVRHKCALMSDYDFDFEMPFDKDGEVFCCETSYSKAGAAKTAEWLNKQMEEAYALYKRGALKAF